MKKAFFLVLSIPAVFLVNACKKDKVKPESPVDPPAKTYDIIIVAGQSNTCYGYDYDSTTMVPSEVLELGRQNKDMQIIKATPSLYNHSRTNIKSSFGYDFARYYLEREAENKKPVLVIACGEIGSAFIDHRWNKGDELYEDLVYRANYILDKYPGSQLVTILWQQGESDVENPDYQQNLDSMIVNLRKDIHFTMPVTGIPYLTPVPFMLGGMVPYWTSQQADRINQENIIAQTENRLLRCYYVNPAGIGKPDNEVDIIHYSDANQRQLAVKYWEKFKTIQ